MNTDKVINDGGPAFPTSELSGEPSTGLSVRDYFAVQAVPVVMKVYEIAGTLPGYKVNIDINNIAHDAYMLADAMLKAREQ